MSVRPSVRVLNYEATGFHNELLVKALLMERASGQEGAVNCGHFSLAISGALSYTAVSFARPAHWHAESRI